MINAYTPAQQVAVMHSKLSRVMSVHKILE